MCTAASAPRRAHLRSGGGRGRPVSVGAGSGAPGFPRSRPRIPSAPPLGMDLWGYLSSIRVKTQRTMTRFPRESTVGGARTLVDRVRYRKQESTPQTPDPHRSSSLLVPRHPLRVVKLCGGGWTVGEPLATTLGENLRSPVEILSNGGNMSGPFTPRLSVTRVRCVAHSPSHL